MAVEITDELLNDVKENIYVSWVEEDEAIKRLIKRNMIYLQSKISIELTFADDTLEYGLLIERCRYDWNRALDEFEKNFAMELLGFIQHYALKQFRESDSDG
ncbi:hypothetical protein ACFC3A_12640 [Enterococcus thailandicus]|uniref:hypothetical protein n=1 Tax=Enterococcus thailandicus TaxID=417368 RepID=UPI0039A70BB9